MLSPGVLSKYKQAIDELSLGEENLARHIRRGNKRAAEAQEVSISEYFRGINFALYD
jgi:hypothetical protein